MPDSLRTSNEYASLGRRRLRAELRERRLRREQLLLSLGELVFELHREGRREPELLRERAAELTELEGELRALEEALEAPPQPAASAQDEATLEAADPLSPQPAARRALGGLAALVAAGVLGWLVTGGLDGDDAPEPEPTLA
ncbi:MAG TPA: hypothetical protein VEQ61_11545, partial [Thermoleophilaceae bacterium]|nr:hypothetical protein [Thermoleophilaceae bacterium]